MFLSMFRRIEENAKSQPHNKTQKENKRPCKSVESSESDEKVVITKKAAPSNVSKKAGTQVEQFTNI